MPLNTLQDDLYVAGNISAESMDIPDDAVDDAAVAAGADIEASKLQHRYLPKLSQVYGSAATAERRVLHVVRGTTGMINEFRIGVTVAALTDATVTVKLRKNGTDILSADIVLDYTVAAFSFVDAAGFTSSAVAAGDVLEWDVTVNAGSGTLPQGLWCQLCLDEDTP